MTFYDLPIDTVNPFSFFFDRVFVIRQENLNSVFISKNPNMYYLDYTATGGVQTKILPSATTSTPKILDSEFNDDDGACP